MMANWIMSLATDLTADPDSSRPLPRVPTNLNYSMISLGILILTEYVWGFLFCSFFVCFLVGVVCLLFGGGVGNQHFEPN